MRVTGAIIIIITVQDWEGDTLEMARISRLDMGAYLCIASNTIPPSVSKQIKVSVDCKFILCSHIQYYTRLFIEAFFFLPEVINNLKKTSNFILYNIFMHV